MIDGKEQGLPTHVLVTSKADGVFSLVNFMKHNLIGTDVLVFDIKDCAFPGIF